MKCSSCQYKEEPVTCSLSQLQDSVCVVHIHIRGQSFIVHQIKGSYTYTKIQKFGATKRHFLVFHENIHGVCLNRKYSKMNRKFIDLSVIDKVGNNDFN